MGWYFSLGLHEAILGSESHWAQNLKIICAYIFVKKDIKLTPK